MRTVPAGDFDYETGGCGYARHRRPDPRFAAAIIDALGSARTVLNVGAGAGSYEPDDRYVVAVEPSAAMRAQRPRGRPALDAVAERLPFDDDSFDAVMATATVHQWPDLAAGLRELRRVGRDRVVVSTFDPDALRRFWLADYCPGLIDQEAGRQPDVRTVASLLGGRSEIVAVPIPLDCTDGFVEAFYGRPEALLDADVRAAQSAWGFVDPDAITAGVDRLRAALDSGEWDARYGHLRRQPHYGGSLRLVVSVPG